MTTIQFATQAYQSDSLPVSAQRCVNAYAEMQPRDAKTPVAVFGAPGIELFANVGNGPIRGIFEMNGLAYVVSDDELWLLRSTGGVSLLGTGITGLNRVSMAGNGVEIAIVNGDLGFIYNTSTETFTQISDSDFEPANTVTFIDSYFVFDKAGSGQFFLSEILDGLTYDALLFASAESHPDRVLACANNNGVLVVFGEKTIETWDHTGASAFPFQRYKGGTVDRGIAGPQAVTSQDQGMFFLGNDRIFYRLQGTRVQRLSKHSMEKEWETYSTISDAFCISMTFGGHSWVYLTFPTAGTTWCYDISTGLWHERESYDSQNLRVRWRGNCVVEAYGQTLIGDSHSNRVGKLDGNAFKEFDTTIIKTLVSPPVHGNGRRAFMPMFELDMDAGVGLANGQGEDPQAMLDWSDDGGRTYGAPQLWRSMGKIGEYQTRLQWDRLGSFYVRHMRLRISDPVKRVVIAARAPGLHVGADMAQDEAPNAPRGNVAFVDRTGALSNEGLLLLEQLWRQVAAGFVTVPCTASGTDLITLTPNLHREGARTYADHMTFAAVAAETSTAAVTAKVADAAGNALSTLKVYKDGGATQAGSGDVVADRLYLFVYVAALDGGAGGFVLK